MSEKCGEWNGLSFYLINNICILGNNQTSALSDVNLCPETVIIPPKVNGYSVLELGRYSLTHCKNMKELIILARITQINEYATWACENLVKVNIPYTCKYIFYSGIHMWNSTRNERVPTPGTANITFEPNSQLTFIGPQGISFRENVNIFFCSKVNMINVDGYPFAFTNPHFFSPYKFRLTESIYVSSNSILPSLCVTQEKKTFVCKKISNNMIYIYNFVIISSK